jgi:hypothetical protein
MFFMHAHTANLKIFSRRRRRLAETEHPATRSKTLCVKSLSEDDGIVHTET